MNKFVPLLLSLLLLAGCALSVKQEVSYRQISADEAILMMKEETDYIILDVRTVEEFSDKHIPEPSIYPTKPSERRKFRSCRKRIS